MILADLCVRRPVFATMFVGALVVLGWFSYNRLGVDLYPKIDVPTVMVVTYLPGAAPEETEARVTKPLEEVINTVSGIDNLRSETLEGVSRIIVEFKLERDLDAAVQDVRDKIATVLDQLPEGTKPPLVQKFDMDSIPVVTFTVTGYQSMKELTEIAQRKLKEPLESVDGVGAIDLVGGREREIHIALDADRLRATGLSVQQVASALAAQNVEFPGGRMAQGMSEEMLRTLGRITNVADFSKIVVSEQNDRPVTIGDIATVEDGVKEPRSESRWDDINAVSLVIRKQSGQNTIEVVDHVNQRLAEIRPALPPGVNVIVSRDSSEFIRQSVRTVQEHLILGGLCAAIVVFFFLGSVRSTLIAAVSIPVSIVSTYSLLLWMGFTLNTMTLLALTLAVGIVIDDAIVVLENIFRFIEEKGMAPMEAAKAATAEVGLAVSATTLSLVVIFVPVAFIHGVMGRFLNSFGLTMAFSILVSLLVGFTLTPMLCSRFLPEARPARRQSRESAFFRPIENGYERALEWSLDHRWVLVLSAFALVASIPLLARLVGASFMPDDDSSEFAINLQTPPGYSLAHTDEVVRQIEARMRRLPETRHIFTTVGDTNGDDRVTVAQVVVKLAPLNERRRTQEQVMSAARGLLTDFPALRTSVDAIKPWEQNGLRDVDVEYDIQGPDLDRLQYLSNEVRKQVQTIPGVVDLDSSYEAGLPELQVHIDRQEAADLGVSVGDLASTIRTLVQGDVVTRYREGQDTYDVRLQLAEKDRNDPAVVSSLTVPSSTIGQVRLDNVAMLVHGTGPTEIDRQDRQRQIALMFSLAPGAAMNTVMNQVEERASKLQLPPGYRTTFGGMSQTKMYGEMMTGFIIAILLSIIFMYMVLAAQFESFVHPVTIMLSLPLSVPFALISLLFFGEQLMLYSVLGILLLFGIVKKNSILQIDQTINLRALGMARREAILAANRERLRPILMTTAALVAGMIPVALGAGAGAASHRALATVVIGGQTLCLLITLLITPVAYSLFDDLETWWSGTVLRKKPKLALVAPSFNKKEDNRLAVD
ncbi:MAG TPA: efflux RND transporter permease subunit [Candidatus Binataceae bacterium]|nr:efflux RND transporter permease subunit [Candidatus Binataceae bacterium]